MTEEQCIAETEQTRHAAGAAAAAAAAASADRAATDALAQAHCLASIALNADEAGLRGEDTVAMYTAAVEEFLRVLHMDGARDRHEEVRANVSTLLDRAESLRAAAAAAPADVGEPVSAPAAAAAPPEAAAPEAHQTAAAELDMRRLVDDLSVSEQHAECAICFETLSQTACATLVHKHKNACAHFYHLTCANELLSSSWGARGFKHCPICRAEFDAVRAVPDITDDADGWWFCVDVDGNGELSRQEVVNVLHLQVRCGCG